MTIRPFPSVLLAAAVALTVAIPQPAAAQSSAQLNDLNGEWAAIAESERADLVLLPVLSEMDAPPSVASTIVDAALLTPDSPGWADAWVWASAPAQVAVLDALKEISERRSRFVFAQPYGRAAGNAAMDAGLWTDLGDPELLANAQFGWFEALDQLGALVQIEATKLAADGEGVEAMELMTRWIRFARNFADRLYFEEKSKAMNWMMFGVERVRDLAYLYSDSIDDVEMRSIIRELDERELNVGRILLPRADRLAAEELLAQTFVERGGPNPDTFGRTFAQLESRDRPLRLFSEAARWQSAAGQHANHLDTRDAIEDVYRDWNLRWSVSPFDLILDQPAHFQSIDAGRYALVANVVPDIEPLFDQRLELRTQIAGSQLALAAVAYKTWTNSWPDPIFAVRPRFISDIPIDPWDPAEDEPLRFFVPIRDLPSTERVQPGPHEMEIVGNTNDFSPPSPESDGLNVTQQSVLDWLIANANRPAIGATPLGPEMIEATRPSGSQRVLLRDIDNAAFQEAVRLATSTQGRNALTEFKGDVPDWAIKVSEASRITYKNTTEQIAVAMTMVTFSNSYRDAWNNRIANKPNPTLGDYAGVIADSIPAVYEELNSMSLVSDSNIDDYSIPSFSVSLDDTQFVLYSVGPDGNAQRAVRVGPGGDDVLLWPPLISLVREELANN